MQAKAEKMPHKINLKAIHAEKEMCRYSIDSEFFSTREHSLINAGEVDVCAEVKKNAGEDGFTMHLSMNGYVVVPCDRCLGDLKCPVAVEKDVKVTFGSCSEEQEQSIVVDEVEGQLDLDPLIYDYSVLSVPLHAAHEEGACDAGMIENLNKYLVH